MEKKRVKQESDRIFDVWEHGAARRPPNKVHWSSKGLVREV
jgi:hypothetical protein